MAKYLKDLNRSQKSNKKLLLLNDIDLKNLGQFSYESILGHINCFRRSNGTTDTRMNFTTPVSFYYKLFFYFDDTVDQNDSARLLGLSYDDVSLTGPKYGDSALEDDLTFLKYLNIGKKVDNGAGSINNQANSAINFLLQNCEYERAEKLLHFIKLLSDISSYEPWQFQSIQGVDEALNRKYFSDGNFTIPEERRSITIKCLQEGYNSRIGTLMDLYRDICYSYYWKKEIVPDNLRKFDMGLFIFTQPVRRFMKSTDVTINANGINASPKVTTKYSLYDIPDKNIGNEPINYTYHTSVKYIEFHNCEFDYNSCISMYSDLNNAEGKAMMPELKIYYDEALEMRYNEFLMRVIGDMVFQDTDFTCDSTLFQQDSNVVKTKTANIAKKIEYKDPHENIASNPILDFIKGTQLGQRVTNAAENFSVSNFVGNATKDAIAVATEPLYVAKSKLRKIALGNLNGTSLSDIADIGENILNGNIRQAAAKIKAETANNINNEQELNSLRENSIEHNHRGFIKLPYKMSENQE